MKILQYFLLLLALSAVALIVFILTQNPSFKVERQFKVDVPKNIVYKYVKDLNNWSNWIDSKKLENGTYEIAIDKLGVYNIQSEYNYPFDSITQDILNDKGISNISWKFAQSIDSTSTIVDFKLESALDLKTKILTFFKGSPNEIARKEIEKNTNAFEVHFIKQYKEFKLDSLGVKAYQENCYLTLEKKTVRIDQLKDNIVEDYAKLMEFCTVNAIENTNKLTLVFYPSANSSTLTYQGAIAIEEQIFLHPDDAFQVLCLPKSSYFETLLKGYYSHIAPSVQKSQNLLQQAGYTQDTSTPILLELQGENISSNLPSEWQTKIEIPLKEIPLMETQLIEVL
ncbi:SRPBCC family protein [Myroides sp. LJL116]